MSRTETPCPSGAEAPPKHCGGEERSLASSRRDKIGQGEVLVEMEIRSKRKTLDNAKSAHAAGDAIPFIQALQTVAKALLSEKKPDQNGMGASRFRPAPR